MNKDFSGYDLSSPEDFLSSRAIERREQIDIQLDAKDLPVSKMYLDSIRSMGAKINTVSKWLNGAVISVDTVTQLQLISAQHFVKQIDTVRFQSNVVFNKKENGTKSASKNKKSAVSKKVLKPGGYDYGFGKNQLEMMNLDHLHFEGFDGSGVIIAVVDAGFSSADQMRSLDHLFAGNRIIATRDFVDNDSDVFHGSTHGQIVLSIMASRDNGVYVGAAPGASYVLLRSEDVGSEYPVEEINWAAAAEFADSIGADIINSSLGYTTYDYSGLSYERKDLDGNTAYSTRAADIAASRGMLVVNSAGNEGNSPWYYISAPADGDSVLTVGAVNQQGYYSMFSSKGPAFDGDLKPNVVAVGESTVFMSSNDQIASGNGTSFSSPLIAASAACLWQAFPEISNMELKEFIEKSSSQFLQPDSLVGFGLPDFQLAGILLNNEKSPVKNYIKALPNPFQKQLYLVSSIPLGENVVFELFDLSGRLMKKWKSRSSDNSMFYTLSDLNALKQGAYILKVSNTQITRSIKIIKAY